MARPQKDKLLVSKMQQEELLYKPQFKAFEHARTKGGSYLKKYLRNSSGAYINKPVVRDYIFKRDGYSCVMCGSKENLQVDHITPVYQANAETIFNINSVENLQTLCRSCNAGRSPNATT